MLVFSALAWLSLFSTVFAIPTLDPISALSPSQIAEFTPFTHYAAAAGCNPETTPTWSCGVHCQANPTFKPIASGGNGGLIQYWYVGYDSTLNTVIVGYQGTNVSDILAILTDLNIILKPLDSALFPGIGSSVEAHAGFADAHARSARPILVAVNIAIAQFNATSVTSVGHSLGAALALLNSVYLPLHLPSGMTFNTIGYGMPRVGNQAFADYVDAHVSKVRRVNNKKDPVPILPPRLIGYHHASGEIHISESNAWESCPGQDNPSTLCSVGNVPSIFDGVVEDHVGPYNGITIGAGCD